MNQDNHIQTTATVEETSDFLTLQDLWLLVRERWYIVLGCVLLSLGLAALYILTTPPVYKRTASILIKDDAKGKSLANDIGSAFGDLGLFKSNVNINNELLSMQSPMLIDEVVKRLDLRTTYETSTGLYKELLYGSTLPVRLRFLDLSEDESVTCRLHITPEGKVSVSDFKSRERDLEVADAIVLPLGGEAQQTPVGRVAAVADSLTTLTSELEILVNRVSQHIAINNLQANLKVTLAEEKSTTLNLSMLDRSKERADDILNTLVVVYNENWLADRNLSAVNASRFIDNRLGIIEKDLGVVDRNISNYKSQHLLPDVEAASTVFLTQASQVNAQIVELRGREQMARQIRNLLKSFDKSKLLPVNSFINNPALEKQIAEFNELLLKRNNLVKSSSETNPLVEDLDHSLEELKRVIGGSLDNQLLSIETQLRSLQASEQQNIQRIAASPGQANYLMTEGRQQKVKEALYLFLLQKREENELTQAFTANNTRLISVPMGSPIPAFPNKRNILLAAFVIGLIFPIALIYLRKILDSKVRTKEDLDGLSLPLIGEIPLSYKRRPLIDRFVKHPGADISGIVVEANGRNHINEAFRSARTNLEFVMKKGQKKVIMTTSLIPGSGKSFSVINLAKSLVLKGKKVLVIDLDIRKAATSKLIGEPHVGVTTYLGEMINDYYSIISRGSLEPELDVIPVGTIPPNPTELLESERLAHLVNGLRADYDYIFLDCPPVEIVADVDIISPLADLTLFVIRGGTIDRKDLKVVEGFYQSGKYPHMTVLLNDTDLSQKRYGYGQQYGYVQ